MWPTGGHPDAVVPELVAERGPRACEAGLHRAHRTAHDVRYLALGQSLEVQEEDRARLRGQAHHRRLDLVPHDTPEPIQVDVVLKSVVVRRLVRGGDRVQSSDDGIMALPAVRAHEGVAKNAEEPGLQVGPGRELRGRAKRAWLRRNGTMRGEGRCPATAGRVPGAEAVGEPAAPEGGPGPGLHTEW